MRRSRALIFDLDDTLYPERDFVASGFRAAGEWIASRFGLAAEQTAADLMALHDNGARGDTFDRWLEGHGLAVGGNLGGLVEAYRRHVPAIRPYDAVPGLLERLRGRYRLGLISDGLAEVQKRKLDALGLAASFEAVVFSDLYGREFWKPSIKPFEVALEKLECPAVEAVYIADNPLKDFLGARRLGMAAIRVRHPGGYYAACEPPTPEHAPDLEIDDIGRLEGIIHG